MGLFLEGPGRQGSYETDEPGPSDGPIGRETSGRYMDPSQETHDNSIEYFVSINT